MFKDGVLLLKREMKLKYEKFAHFKFLWKLPRRKIKRLRNVKGMKSGK